MHVCVYPLHNNNRRISQCASVRVQSNALRCWTALRRRYQKTFSASISRVNIKVFKSFHFALCSNLFLTGKMHVHWFPLQFPNPESSISISHVITILIFYLVIYWISWIIYARTLHPLAKVPGPFWPSVSRTWLMYRMYAGDFQIVQRALHQQFVPMLSVD
jgi:hypothetical protein